jgi:hypothetical protein
MAMSTTSGELVWTALQHSFLVASDRDDTSHENGTPLIH